MANTVFVIISMGISCIYLWAYKKTRNETYCIPETIGGKFPVLLGFNIIMILLMKAPNSRTDFIKIVSALLIIILSDIDIMIMKIPTELLTLFGVSVFLSFIHDHRSPLLILSDVLIYILMSKLSKKNIAQYDLILSFILAMQFYDVIGQLKYTSVFLILWGAAGVIIRKFRRNTSQTMAIPLAPIMTISYILAAMISY